MKTKKENEKCLFTRGETTRGFGYLAFKDDDGDECSLQESSSFEPHVWLGVNKPEISIMHRDAVAAGLSLPKDNPETGECGWCTMPLPNGALIESRMHLTQAQAMAIAEELMHFARSGNIRGTSDNEDNAEDEESDAVNNPSHYADGGSHGAEVIDIAENLDFCRGNVIKYVARAGRKDKDKELEDLKKAQWYLRREIERLENRDDKG